MTENCIECGKPLVYVKEKAACGNERCPMHRVIQDTCCGAGEEIMDRTKRASSMGLAMGLMLLSMLVAGCPGDSPPGLDGPGCPTTTSSSSTTTTSSSSSTSSTSSTTLCDDDRHGGDCDRMAGR